MFRTEFRVKDEETKQQLTSIASDIAKRDSTFTFKAERAHYPKDLCTIVVYSATEKQAWARGNWLNKKSGIPHLFYQVREALPNE